MNNNLSPEEKSRMLTILTVEHTALQTARTATVFESTGRATLFFSVVSSAVVALAFIGQVSEISTPFFIFALVLLPTLVIMGWFTFVRAIQSAIEDTLYVRGINRIRHFYIEDSPKTENYFVLSTHDDQEGIWKSMAISGSRGQPLYTTSSMIAFVNSVLVAVSAGAAARLRFDWSTIGDATLGASFFVLSFMLHYFYQYRMWLKADFEKDVKFPGQLSASDK